MLVATLFFGGCDSFFLGVGLHIRATPGGEIVTEAGNVPLAPLIWWSHQASSSNLWLSSWPWHSDTISKDFIDLMVWDEGDGMGCGSWCGIDECEGLGVGLADVLLVITALSSKAGNWWTVGVGDPGVDTRVVNGPVWQCTEEGSGVECPGEDWCRWPWSGYQSGWWSSLTMNKRGFRSWVPRRRLVNHWCRWPWSGYQSGQQPGLTTHKRGFGSWTPRRKRLVNCWWASSSDTLIYPSIFAFPSLSLHHRSTTTHLRSDATTCDRARMTIALALSDWSCLFDGHMTYNSHIFTSILSVSNVPPPVVQPIMSSCTTQSGTFYSFAICLCSCLPFIFNLPVFTFHWRTSLPKPQPIAYMSLPQNWDFALMLCTILCLFHTISHYFPSHCTAMIPPSLLATIHLETISYPQIAPPQSPIGFILRSPAP